MNSSIPANTQKALYLILGGLLAKPLMDMILSIINTESGKVEEFLGHFGSLGSVGLAGLGVIMLLSETLAPRANEDGNDAAISTLIRVAMVFVIVIMLVILMELTTSINIK